MEEITVKGHRRGLWIMAAVNLAIASYNGWNWIQGNIGPSTKAFTILFGGLLVLKLVLLSKPMFMRVSGDRFHIRMGFYQMSTSAANVSNLDYTGGQVHVVFRDLSQVQVSKSFLQIMEQGFRNRGRHLDFPLGSDVEGFDRLREATLKDRA